MRRSPLGLQGLLTIEVKLQLVCIDTVMWNAELAGDVFNDRAKSSRDKKDLHISLM